MRIWEEAVGVCKKTSGLPVQRSRFKCSTFQVQVARVAAALTCPVCLLRSRVLKRSDSFTNVQFFGTLRKEHIALGLLLVDTRPLANSLHLFMWACTIYSLRFQVWAWNNPNDSWHCTYYRNFNSAFLFQQKQYISPNWLTLSSGYAQLEHYWPAFGRYRLLIPGGPPSVVASIFIIDWWFF